MQIPVMTRAFSQSWGGLSLFLLVSPKIELPQETLKRIDNVPKIVPCGYGIDVDAVSGWYASQSLLNWRSLNQATYTKSKLPILAVAVPGYCTKCTVVKKVHRRGPCGPRLRHHQIAFPEHVISDNAWFCLFLSRIRCTCIEHHMIDIDRFNMKHLLCTSISS